MRTNKLLKTILFGITPFALSSCSNRFTPSWRYFDTFVSMSFKGENICDELKEGLGKINDLADCRNVRGVRNVTNLNTSSDFVEYDPALIDMLLEANYWEYQTDGFYSPLGKNINDLWLDSIKKHENIDSERLSEEVAKLHGSSIEIDGNKAKINGEANCNIDLIARCYGIDYCQKEFKDHGIEHYCVNIGSTEFAMTTSNDRGGTFDIYIQDTMQGDYLKLKNTCVAIASTYIESDMASYLNVVDYTDGSRNYNNDLVVVVHENIYLASMLAATFLRCSTENLMSYCYSWGCECVAYKDHKVDFHTNNLEVHHYTK